MIIYYDSKTGNVQRFMEKIKDERPDWEIIKINPETIIENSEIVESVEIPETVDEVIEEIKEDGEY